MRSQKRSLSQGPAELAQHPRGAELRQGLSKVGELGLLRGKSPFGFKSEDV